MPASDLLREIGRLGPALLDAGLALDYQPPLLMTGRPGEKRIVMPCKQPPFLTGENPIEEFKAVLRSRAFTFVLADAAVIQVGFSFRYDELVEHRLCYLPCPFDLGDLSLEEILPDMALDDVLEMVEADRLRLRGSLRFDFAPAAARPNHPASHVHVNGSAGRVGVFGPLSLGHFLRFIFRTFYPDVWANHGFLRGWPARQVARSIRQHEEVEIFIEQRPPA